MDLYGHMCACVSLGMGMGPQLRKGVEVDDIYCRPKSYKLLELVV